MELQQSPLYLKYIRRLGWQITKIDNVAVIYRNIFIFGGIAKIQRSNRLPDLVHLQEFIHKENIKSIAIEPSANFSQKELTEYCVLLSAQVKINSSPFLPTKTILIDLLRNDDEIFQTFNEAKRRAVRRAHKNEIQVITSYKIDEMIRIKSKSAGFLGGLTTYGLRQLWETFSTKHAAILLAINNHNRHPELALGSKDVIGGVFLLFNEKTAYYWIVGSTHEGKKLFAPTLLVWEAIKLAKKHGCTLFDFVGVWDERLPRLNKEWLGFTKFKEGFGGKILYYPIAKPRK